MVDIFSVVFCTCPDQQSANRLAQKLVSGHLAACVNIIPGITSIYPWNDEIESSQEHLLLIKTNSQSYAELETLIKNNHPYELPEIIAVPIQRGLPEYLNWIAKWLNEQS